MLPVKIYSDQLIKVSMVGSEGKVMNKFSNTEQHLGSLLILYISLLVFFHHVIFEDYTYLPADTLASHSWETLEKDAEKEGIVPLWNPYIFCGMPLLASVTMDKTDTWYNDTIAWTWGKVHVGLSYLFVKQDIGQWLTLYLIYAFGVYLLAYHLFKIKPIAIIVALAALYSTRVINLIMIGHYTKLAVLCWFPYIFLFVIKAQSSKQWWWYLIGLIVVLHLMFSAGHVQYIYYIYLSLIAYFLYIVGYKCVKSWHSSRR